MFPSPIGESIFQIKYASGSELDGKVFPSPIGESIFQILNDLEQCMRDEKSFRPLSGNLYFK